MNRKTRLRTFNSKIDVERNSHKTGGSNIDLLASTEIKKDALKYLKFVI